MAALFGTIIVAACTTIQTPYMDACQKTIDATARQIGIRQQLDQIEDGTTSYVEGRIKAQFTETQLGTVGTVLAGYKIYRDKHVSFKLPTLGICNSISNDIALDSYSLTLAWRF